MNPPEPAPAPSATTRRRKTMDEIRRVGLMSSEYPPEVKELLHQIVEASQPPVSETPVSEKARSPLRVARSPHPLDNFSFDQLCPEDDDDDQMAQTISPEEALTAALDKFENTAPEAVRKTTAELQQDLPKGVFKGPGNKARRQTVERKVERFVPKTMIDFNLIRQNMSVSVAKSNEILAKKVAEKEAEPPKPFIAIENYKMAQTACPFVWGEMDAPKERFRYCDKCNASVYNFAGMELPEAEELIFKREQRRNAPLFKRADGKFMTRDCPVALKKKYGLAMMIAGGILVLAILAVLAMLMPAPPPPNPAEAPSSGVTPEVQTIQSQPQPSTTQTGSESGQGGAVVPPVTQPPAVEPSVQLDPNANPNGPGS